MCEDMEKELILAGIIFSRKGRPAIHREQNISAIKSQFGDRVLRTTLNERVAVSDSAAKKKPIYDLNDTNAANEFRAMSKELLGRVGISK